MNLDAIIYILLLILQAACVCDDPMRNAYALVLSKKLLPPDITMHAQWIMFPLISFFNRRCCAIIFWGGKTYNM